MKTFSRIASAFVLSSLLISAPTSAAPDGSLKKMLDTNITLIEYIALQTRLDSVERLATGEITKWGDYSGVVKMSAWFSYKDGNLDFTLTPVDNHVFSTVAEAKSYCRDLIRAERRAVWLLLLLDSTPNGWSTASLDADEFQAQLYRSSIISTSIYETNIAEKVPDEEYRLECIASLDDEGKIKSFSYNL